MTHLLISIVIPAHNRPAFLLEAVGSIAAQTYSNYEVVVIDDGSTPPISRPALEEVLGAPVVLYRHDSAQGVPKAKNAGVKAARGEIILLLDDDDLLMPDSLERIFHAFSNYPEIDCLFLAVQPFGAYSEGPERNRKTAIDTILGKTNPEERNGLYFFSNNLFDALLDRVPIDFQRPAARRGMWNIAGGFGEESLFSESAWAIRASCIGTIALTKEPATQWRIHGNNFGWPANLELDQIKIWQIENGISSGIQLFKSFRKEERAWHDRAKRIRHYHAENFFSKASYLYDKNWIEGVKALIHSFTLAPQTAHLKLGIKYLLPLRLIKYMSDRKNNEI